MGDGNVIESLCQRTIHSCCRGGWSQQVNRLRGATRETGELDEIEGIQAKDRANRGADAMQMRRIDEKRRPEIVSKYISTPPYCIRTEKNLILPSEVEGNICT